MTRRRKPRAITASIPQDVTLPTQELAGHHDIAERRIPNRPNSRAWKVQTNIEKLWITERIDNAEYHACVRFYEDWSFGMHGCSPGLSDRVSESYSAAGMTDGRVDAVSRINRVYAASSREARIMLDACICDDVSFRECGRRLGVDHHQAAKAMVRTAKFLSDHYKAEDQGAK